MHASNKHLWILSDGSGTVRDSRNDHNPPRACGLTRETDRTINYPPNCNQVNTLGKKSAGCYETAWRNWPKCLLGRAPWAGVIKPRWLEEKITEFMKAPREEGYWWF